MSSSKQQVIGFWKPNERNGRFSQWWLQSFKDDFGIEYCCAEQYMMAQKAVIFNDDASRDNIMRSHNPFEMKRLGSQVKNFSDDVWDSNKYNIVLDATYLKFSRNEDLKKFLLDTNDALLVEASPYDTVWGVGTSSLNPRDFRGENLLGEALMEVRKLLREESKKV